jgi:hypothetical protein
VVHGHTTWVTHRTTEPESIRPDHGVVCYRLDHIVILVAHNIRSRLDLGTPRHQWRQPSNRLWCGGEERERRRSHEKIDVRKDGSNCAAITRPRIRGHNRIKISQNSTKHGTNDRANKLFVARLKHRQISVIMAALTGLPLRGSNIDKSV